MPEQNSAEKIDVAVNIFAKPLMTSLAILSLLRFSGQHVGKLWLQFEPQGVKGDPLLPYCIYDYLKEKALVPCEVYQPEIWYNRLVAEPERFSEPEYRLGRRYQHAFEHSRSRLLFIMHNDIFVFKDILGAMRDEIGDAFAIGQLGQCWNCPASRAELTREALGREACAAARYQDFQINASELRKLYALSHEKGIFARPYDLDGFTGSFEAQPWPLPECRINEWACLINLEKTRPLTIPFGDGFPFGGYQPCGGCNLDIGTAWFRDMHRKGLKAKNFDVKAYMRHWIGTGKNTPVRYARAEANARAILKKHFPEYIQWLEAREPGSTRN